MILPLLLFSGVVTGVHDGDGPIYVRTEQGPVKVRLQGIQAPDYEDTEPCRQHRAGYTCSDHQAEASRQKLLWIVGKRISCEPTGTSYSRVTAWCSVAGKDMSCAQVSAGAAVRWARYDRAGQLVRCGR